ncbi:MAG: PAS domain S-box protein [Methanomicrobiales archaeon]|nr:PAS domain S-box protein [Methanomicrobiales archaeon]
MDSVHDRILNVLTGQKKSLNIREIAQRCGLNPHSTARHLDTLEILGQVRKIEIGSSKKYYLVNSIPVSGLIDVASDLIVIVNSEHKIEYLNYSAQKKLGLEGRQVSGERLETLNLDIFSSSLVLQGLKSYTPEKIFRIEIPYDRCEDHLWYSVSIMNLCLKPGSISIAIIAEDITSQKRSQIFQELIVSVLQILNFRGKGGGDTITQILQAIRNSTLVEAIGIMLHTEYDFPIYQQVGLSEAFTNDQALLYTSIKPKKMEQFTQGKGTPVGMNERVLSGDIDHTYDFFTQYGSFYTNNITNLLASYPDPDSHETPLKRCKREGYESLAIIPLHSHEGIIGVLQLLDKRKNVFSPEMTEFFEGLSNAIGIALEHQYMEKKVRESESKYRMIADNASDVIWSRDLEGNYTYISPSVFRLRGYTPEEVMKHRLSDVVHPEHFSLVMKRLQNNLKKVQKSKKSHSNRAELKLLHKNGSWIWTEVVNQYVCDDSGNPLKIIGVTRDISQRKKIQEELEGYQSDLESAVMDRTKSFQHEVAIRQQIETLLRKSEQRLADIIDFSPVATFAIDSKDTVIVWNHAIEEMTGFSASDMIGKKKDACAIPIYGQDHVMLIDLLFSESIKDSLDYTHIKREGLVLSAVATSAVIKGEKKTIWIKAAPLYDEESNVTGTIESIRDITDLHKSQQENERQKDLLDVLINSSSTLFVVIDAMGKTLMMNKALCDLLEYSPDEVVGSDYIDSFVPSNGRPKLVKIFNQIIKNGKETHNKNLIMSKSGEQYLVEWYGGPVKRSGGEPDIFIGTGIRCDHLR